MIAKYTQPLEYHTGLDNMVELLIDNGADVNGLYQPNNVSTLIEVISAGRHEEKL